MPLQKRSTVSCLSRSSRQSHSSDKGTRCYCCRYMHSYVMHDALPLRCASCLASISLAWYCIIRYRQYLISQSAGTVVILGFGLVAGTSLWQCPPPHRTSPDKRHPVKLDWLVWGNCRMEGKQAHCLACDISLRARVYAARFRHNALCHVSCMQYVCIVMVLFS